MKVLLASLALAGAAIGLAAPASAMPVTGLSCSSARAWQADHNAKLNDTSISDADYNAEATTIKQTLALACG